MSNVDFEKKIAELENPETELGVAVSKALTDKADHKAFTPEESAAYLMIMKALAFMVADTRRELALY